VREERKGTCWGGCSASSEGGSKREQADTGLLTKAS